MANAEMVVAGQQEVSQNPVAWAIANKVEPAQMLQFLEVQRQIDERDAKRAFNEAFTAFKAEPISIVRDKENTQYSKGEKKAMYTSLENMVATVTPFLSKHGLSASWGVPRQTPTSITVSCTLEHVKGYSKTESIDGPLDESGAKNKLQQVKSSMTYLKVATFESVCGLASAFGSTNDDGNGAGPATAAMSDEDYVAWADAIGNAPHLTGLKATFEAALKAADAAGDRNAKGRFIDLKDKRKSELA